MVFELDTIAAVSTAPGKGAVSVIRISGPLAWEFAFCRTRLEPSCIKPRRFYYATLRYEEDELDDVLLLFFAAPDSYTGEDVLEVQCHGSPFITGKILESCLNIGIRPARPGEFTYRAVLNGKMDLTQAEAVRDLIESKTALQGKIARDMIKGRLSSRLSIIREELISIASQMETLLEFVEEDVTPQARSTLLERMDSVLVSLGELEEGYQRGRILKDGVFTVLAGITNTGKSLVFNALSEEDRAIVTSHAGTTRDVIVEELDLEGIPFLLHDTAGIRRDTGEIEGIGVARSLEHFGRAALVLFVLDSSREWSGEDRNCWEQIRTKKVILVVNKIDLERHLEIPPEVIEACLDMVEISALNGENLSSLIHAMVKSCWLGDQDLSDSCLISNIRQKECLARAGKNMLQCREAYASGLSEEYPLQDLRKSMDALGEMTGEIRSEDILDQVFRTFCIGK
ncbi:MAG: tRNA uridine-5-carboxymethylaminomethyl(34) synthesis GTPase MnmE [Acidobacteriota bacterium]